MWSFDSSYKGTRNRERNGNALSLAWLAASTLLFSLSLPLIASAEEGYQKLTWAMKPPNQTAVEFIREKMTPACFSPGVCKRFEFDESLLVDFLASRTSPLDFSRINEYSFIGFSSGTVAAVFHAIAHSIGRDGFQYYTAPGPSDEYYIPGLQSGAHARLEVWRSALRILVATVQFGHSLDDLQQVKRVEGFVLLERLVADMESAVLRKSKNVNTQEDEWTWEAMRAFTYDAESVLTFTYRFIWERGFAPPVFLRSTPEPTQPSYLDPYTLRHVISALSGILHSAVVMRQNLSTTHIADRGLPLKLIHIANVLNEISDESERQLRKLQKYYPTFSTEHADMVRDMAKKAIEGRAVGIDDRYSCIRLLRTSEGRIPGPVDPNWGHDLGSLDKWQALLNPTSVERAR